MVNGIKCFFKSIDTTEHFFKFSILSFIVSITSARASPVDIFFLNPYCDLSIIEYLFKKSTKRNLIIFTKYLEICCKIDIGLKFNISFLEPDLFNDEFIQSIILYISEGVVGEKYIFILIF